MKSAPICYIDHATGKSDHVQTSKCLGGVSCEGCAALQRELDEERERRRLAEQGEDKADEQIRALTWALQRIADSALAAADSAGAK